MRHFPAPFGPALSQQVTCTTHRIFNTGLIEPWGAPHLFPPFIAGGAMSIAKVSSPSLDAMRIASKPLKVSTSNTVIQLKLNLDPSLTRPQPGTRALPDLAKSIWSDDSKSCKDNCASPVSHGVTPASLRLANAQQTTFKTVATNKPSPIPSTDSMFGDQLSDRLNLSLIGGSGRTWRCRHQLYKNRFLGVLCCTKFNDRKREDGLRSSV